jgi:hypothetical protein
MKIIRFHPNKKQTIHLKKYDDHMNNTKTLIQI